jgi:hypothetical protein
MTTSPPRDPRGRILRLFILLLGALAAVVSLVSWLESGTVAPLMAAAGFGLMTYVWHRWLPESFFAAPLRHLLSNVPKQNRAEEVLTLVGVFLILGSALLRTTAGLQ